MAKIGEELISAEAAIQELCAQKTIDFQKLLGLMDKAALAERRKKQYGQILAELFPDE